MNPWPMAREKCAFFSHSPFSLLAFVMYFNSIGSDFCRTFCISTASGLLKNPHESELGHVKANFSQGECQDGLNPCFVEFSLDDQSELKA
ncbi:hypothetical protein [Chromobacterium vaccinii]|uniref:hypothetical protein n=1 Tax=Chromobacterium vaccinii TaxID=1108595 RepID=UPI0011AB5F42|nr:hypothetical protein [Chromobacterium vaccinii]